MVKYNLFLSKGRSNGDKEGRFTYLENTGNRATDLIWSNISGLSQIVNMFE